MLIRRERPGETQRVPRDRLASVRLMIVGAVILIAQTRFPTHPSRAPGPAHGSSFDYYVLALSWSPGFCATHSRSLQCGGDDGFVLHGLWPQYLNGGYPSDCKGPAFSKSVSGRVERNEGQGGKGLPVSCGTAAHPTPPACPPTQHDPPTHPPAATAHHAAQSNVVRVGQLHRWVGGVPSSTSPHAPTHPQLPAPAHARSRPQAATKGFGLTSGASTAPAPSRCSRGRWVGG